jgi:hypothetical protein
MVVIMKTNIKTPDIATLIQPLLGQRCWNPSLGHGSFLTFDFGNIKEPARITMINKKGIKGKVPKMIPPSGEWHLWIYMGFWEIWHENQMLVDAEDERKNIESVIHSFGGLALQKILMYPEDEQFDFVFELNHILKVYSSDNRLQDEKLWMLFCPNDYVLTIKDSGHWTYRSSSES